MVLTVFLKEENGFLVIQFTTDTSQSGNLNIANER